MTQPGGRFGPELTVRPVLEFTLLEIRPKMLCLQLQRHPGLKGEDSFIIHLQTVSHCKTICHWLWDVCVNPKKADLVLNQQPWFDNRSELPLNPALPLANLHNHPWWLCLYVSFKNNLEITLQVAKLYIYIFLSKVLNALITKKFHKFCNNVLAHLYLKYIRTVIK